MDANLELPGPDHDMDCAPCDPADAARAVLGVLVGLAPHLPASMLRELIFRLGRCAMTESARSLAQGMGTGHGALRDPSVALPLATLVGGNDGRALQRVLRAAGLTPLAALQAAAWGVGDLDELVLEWAQELEDSTPAASAGDIVVEPPVA